MKKDIKTKTEYFENGKRKETKYYIEWVPFHELAVPLPHREDGPAIIKWHGNGQKRGEMYCQEGRLHRKDGPAERWWHRDGHLHKEVYFLSDLRHRMDGPAMISWDLNGKIVSTEYWLGGDQYTEEEYYRKRTREKIIKRM